VKRGAWGHYIPRCEQEPFEESMEHQDRYIPAETNGGWGVAAGVVLLALVCITVATTIYKKTYKQPTDVTWHARGQRPASEGTTGH
jgi:hypothetical protein